MCHIEEKNCLIEADCIKCIYVSYKNRRNADITRTISWIVPSSDKVGHNWLLKAISDCRNIKRQFVFFPFEYDSVESDEIREIPSSIYVKYQNYLSKLQSSILNALCLNVRGGTHLGRRSLFTNSEKAVLEMQCTNLGISSSTAVDKYVKPGLSIADRAVESSLSGVVLDDFELYNVEGYDGGCAVVGVAEAVQKLVQSGVPKLDFVVGLESGNIEGEVMEIESDSEVSDKGILEVGEIIDSALFGFLVGEDVLCEWYVRVRWKGCDMGMDSWEHYSVLGELCKNRPFIIWCQNSFVIEGNIKKCERVPTIRDVKGKRLDDIGFCRCCWKMSEYDIPCKCVFNIDITLQSSKNLIES